MSRILIVDDQKVPRYAVAKILEEAGYEVTAAESGEEGLSIARADMPDVIVLDVYMPGMDGFGVVEQLKADPATAPTPVIFLTAEPPTDDLIVRGLELGAYDFLSKGCSRAELLARVGVMTRIKRANDELSAVARISDTLIQSLDPAKLSRQFVAQVCDVFRADAVLLSYSADSELPPDVAVDGMDVDPPLAESLARALHDRLESLGQTQCEVGLDELSGAAAMVARRHGMQSILAARVDHAERSPTLLALLARRPNSFTRASDPPLLQLLARQATIALDNAYLHERTRLQADKMEEQADKLERAMTERSRFFASMSHELRTPINAVIGYKELLSLGAYGPMNEQQTTAVERLGRSAQHLLELINDVLDISKIEAGKMEMNLEPTDLSMLVKETMPTVQILADEKGLEMEVRTIQGAVLNTDPARVRQIVLNLLSNAVKFTEKGRVEVEVRGEPGGGYAIRVADTGHGIALEDQERIFEEFEQTNNHSSSGGTGLGLPISKRLAHLLGGQLSVESEIGKGSTFILTLPDTPADTSSNGDKE